MTSEGFNGSNDWHGDFYRAVFENVTIGICLMDLDGRIILANACMAQILGYSQEELHSKTCFEITHPDDRNFTREKMMKLRHESNDEIMKLLNDEQKTEFKKIIEEQRKRMQERMQNRGN